MSEFRDALFGMVLPFLCCVFGAGLVIVACIKIGMLVLGGSCHA